MYTFSYSEAKACNERWTQHFNGKERRDSGEFVRSF